MKPSKKKRVEMHQGNCIRQEISVQRRCTREDTRHGLSNDAKRCGVTGLVTRSALHNVRHHVCTLMAGRCRPFAWTLLAGRTVIHDIFEESYRNGEPGHNSIVGLTLLQESRQFSSRQLTGGKLSHFSSLTESCSIS